MDLFLHHGDRSYHVAVLDRAEQFRTPFEGRPFPCLIWDTDGSWSEQDRARLAGGLLAAGCRYAVCGGTTSGRWEAAVDAAFVDLDLQDSDWDERFVMTTSHEGETLDDVAEFFVSNTNFNQHEFADYLVLQLGHEIELERRLRARVAASAVGDADPQDDSAESGTRRDP